MKRLQEWIPMIFACKDRCEKQLRVLEEGIDIVSGTVVEFEKDILHCKAKRTLPLSKEEILKFAGRRNPFNIHV